ncbi:MAG: nitrilase-related carbon-nitrogen hydrolase, partial [Planctomycetota bacterium]
MPRSIRVALVQFDASPEAVDDNLEKMRSWVRAAARERARWIVFHEATLCDYTPDLPRLAQPVPDGPATRAMIALARETLTFISFGLSEKAGDRFHISQVFVGPAGYVYHYRKTWLWREPSDEGYRNEWARYDPGAGPELFTLDGVKATCFICADGN